MPEAAGQCLRMTCVPQALLPHRRHHHRPHFHLRHHGHPSTHFHLKRTLAWRLAFEEISLRIGIGLARSLAFEENNVIRRDFTAGHHFAHTGFDTLALTHTGFDIHTAMGWHGGCLFIAGMEAVCLSPWLTHWHGGCLFIAMAHTLAWRLPVYRHGSHTGIHTLAWRLSVYRHGSHTGMEAVSLLPWLTHWQ